MNSKILTIFYQFDPTNPTIGGIQTLIQSFIKYAPNNFKVRVVGATSNSKMPLKKWHEIEVDGSKILFMPLIHIKDDNVRKLIPTTLKYTLALIGCRFKSDFMHFHRLEPAIAALPWASNKVLFIHNDIHQQMVSKDYKDAILWRHFPALYFAIERILVKQFSQILSCNTDSALLYKKHYPHLADRISFVKNSVDDELFFFADSEERDSFRVNLAEKLNLQPDTHFLLFAGRLHPQKDPLLLVNVINVLKDSPIHLLIAGEGELSEKMHHEIKRLDLSKKISMLGSVNKTELSKLQRSSSICILTSIYEGLPLIVLEALSCGTPVVTTNCGETPKVLTAGSGLVCQERTPEAIAESINRILSSPEDFPPEICAQASQPYKASEVISELYSEMKETKLSV